MESTRVDRWLWAVRLYKTRSAASTACQGGHVDVNGLPAKPATKVKVGDRVQLRLDRRDRDLEVARVIDKRVGAPIAAECLVDHSPPEPDRDLVPLRCSTATAVPVAPPSATAARSTASAATADRASRRRWGR